VTAAPTARVIDVATLRSRLEENPPRILDVHTPAEFETAHIPGSYNVPLDLLREHRDESLPAGACRGRTKSAGSAW